MMICGNNELLINKVKSGLAKNFRMKDLGHIRNFMGLSINYDRNKGVMTIDQSNYIRKILEKFNMMNCNPSKTPMEMKLYLDNTEGEKQTTEGYRELVGSLMYLVLGSRPDMCFALNYFSRFQERPTQNHYNHLKRALRYLKGTVDLKLNYNRSNNDVPLDGFVDADWANDTADRKSTSGYLFRVFGNIVSWSSRKQSIVALSTTEAEYVAASSAACEALWFTKIINDLGHHLSEPVKLYEDNQACIFMTRNPETKRTKHIDVRYHFLRECVWSGKLSLEYVSTTDQLADILTKQLPSSTFEGFRNKFGLKREEMLK